jgi:hypothetical protein
MILFYNFTGHDCFNLQFNVKDRPWKITMFEMLMSIFAARDFGSIHETLMVKVVF